MIYVARTRCSIGDGLALVGIGWSIGGILMAVCSSASQTG